MKKQFYLDIKDRLKTILDDNGNQLLKHFDLWNQQVEFIEQETPFACPAVFVEFMPVNWETLGNRHQMGRQTVRLHIVTEWYAGTADYSPTEDRALEYLDIVDKVVARMQNFRASCSNSFTRTQSVPNHNHEKFVDSIEEYTCEVFDNSAVQRRTEIRVTPVINID